MLRNPSINLSVSAFGGKYALPVESTAIHIEIEMAVTVELPYTTIDNYYIPFIL